MSYSDDWMEKLTHTCAYLHASSYYIADMVPEKKRENAMKLYPPPQNGRIAALIDTTIFGSAKSGMLISEYGISWKNNWINPSANTSMIWEEVARKSIVQKDKYLVVFDKNSLFDTCGSTIEIKKLIHLFEKIQSLFLQHHAQPETPLLDINQASFDDILSLPGIGIAEAKSIIQYREEGVVFTSTVDLINLLGLKPHLTQQLTSYIHFNQGADRPATPDRDDAARQAPSMSSRNVIGRTID